MSLSARNFCLGNRCLAAKKKKSLSLFVLRNMVIRNSWNLDFFHEDFRKVPELQKFFENTLEWLMNWFFVGLLLHPPIKFGQHNFSTGSKFFEFFSYLEKLRKYPGISWKALEFRIWFRFVRSHCICKFHLLLKILAICSVFCVLRYVSSWLNRLNRLGWH